MTRLAINLVKIAIVTSPLVGVVFCIGGFANLTLIAG